jgi:Fur family ferric uptake transcriptional regulator
MDDNGPRNPAADAQGRKTTAQRAAVLGVLGMAGRFRTAQDIFSELRSKGERVGLTTVYRNLQKLAADGVIHTVQTSERQTAYRRCSDRAHHHLVCTQCCDGVEISDSNLDRWVESEAANRGYSDVTHSVEIFGVCPACTKLPAETAGWHSASQDGPTRQSSQFEGGKEQR